MTVDPYSDNPVLAAHRHATRRSFEDNDDIVLSLPVHFRVKVFDRSEDGEIRAGETGCDLDGIGRQTNLDFLARANVLLGMSIDRAYAADHWFARPDEPGLKSFMIDAGRQGQGVGTAAVRALDAYLPARYPGIRSVVLTVNMANPAAIRTYRAGGFVDTGEIYEGGRAGPQLVMRMPLAG